MVSQKKERAIKITDHKVVEVVTFSFFLFLILVLTTLQYSKM